MNYKEIKVHFKYESQRIETIKCIPNEKLRDICLLFSKKINIDFDSVIFVLNGRKIEQNDFNKSLNQLVAKSDKNNIYIY